MSEMIEIPEDWEIIELGDVLKIETGSKNAENSSVNGVYPFFTRAEETQKIDTYSYDTEALFIAGEGNFRVKYYNGKFEAHQRTYVLTSKDNSIDLSYLQKAIQPKITRLISTSVGSTVMSLRKPQIAEIDVLSPKKKKEQQKIAEVLNEVDNAISKIEELFEKNKRIKTALMQDLLNYGVDENGKVRSCETHKFKLSELGDIPEEWDCLELAKVCDIKDGTHQTPKYVSDGIPFYSVENITNNEFKNVKFISYEEHKELTKNYKIELGDVLMTRIGSIGDCKYINWNVNASFYVSLALLKFYNKEHAKYFVQYSKSAKFKNEIDLHSLPNAVPKKINLGNISNVKILIPKSETEQQKIAQILSSQDEKIEDIKNKLNKLKSLKTSLMQDLLSGKVRVTKLMEENS